MRILFEEHKYQPSEVEADLNRICDLQGVDKKVSVSMVGYFYNSDPDIHDCVFILPKVLLKEVEVDDFDGKKKKIDVIADVPKKEDGSFVRPEDIITPDGQLKYLTPEYRKFIYEFAVWIYRALTVYRLNNPESDALRYRQLPQESRGQRHKTNTFLDIILSLIRFNRDNQDFFFFIVKNLHSGHNKINWTKTISHSQAFVQDNSPVYLNLVNKRRQINFDEELMIIYFSILNYLNEAYGFNEPIPLQYELLKGHAFKRYCDDGVGKKRLKEIKYKYFSDKALELWDLCYAFFENEHIISLNTTQKEYLLAMSFEVVFEAMIDELIGNKDVPRGLKEQFDNKRIDHMYTYYGLTYSDDNKDDEIYYIGDSKYYKVGHKLGQTAIYKQFTYARNVIQWNIDLFIDDLSKEGWTSEELEAYRYDQDNYKKIRLRDDFEDQLTEGYNVIPNFFISAFVNEQRQFVADNNIIPRPLIKNGSVVKDEDGHVITQTYISHQFRDRLFDRDTLILSHYDVNFLYVLYLYARNKAGEKLAWREKVRGIFRDEIRYVLKQKYDFYAMKSRGNVLAGEQFIKDHFKELQGKLYRPYKDKNIFSLALERHDNCDTKDSEAYKLLDELFEIIPVQLGNNPKIELDEKVKTHQASHPYVSVPQNWLPEYHIERYLEDYFVVGLYHDQEHWDWITGKNDRGTLIYNVRLDPEREGSIPKSRIRKMRPKFAILYEDGHEKDNKYHVFRIHDYAEMNERRMRQALYPREPQGDYFIFRFDEEVTIGRFDIGRYIQNMQTKNGVPLYPKGKDLLEYKL